MTDFEMHRDTVESLMRVHHKVADRVKPGTREYWITVAKTIVECIESQSMEADNDSFRVRCCAG